MKRRISKYIKKMEEGGLNTPWKKNRAPSYFPRKDHRMQTNLSTIFRPTIRHGSLNNAYANIGSPFRGDGQKIGFFIRSTKANSPFFFLFFFRFTPFLPPLFSAPGKCDSWPATFRLCPPLPPSPRNFQKAAQDRAA